MLFGSNFKRAGGKHPPDLSVLKKLSPFRVKLSVCTSVSPVDSLDDGACHKRNLVEAGWSDVWAGETIQQHIALPSGNLLVGYQSDASGPRFPE